jgi:DeoR/GlpR family transcriptional regulator of sugar metabolism
LAKISSKSAERQDKILVVLELDPAIRVNELARTLGVSSETVRRDLAKLDEIGQIRRTYGGAVRANEFEPALADRLKLFTQERERMARHAVALIEGETTLIVGGGATTLHFARSLRNIDRRITVLTPTFDIAAELAKNPLIEVMFLPGIVEPLEGLVCGPETVNAITQYKIPVAILGASAIDERGVSEALLPAAQVYAVMTEHSDRTIILADYSKFGKRTLRSILDWGHDTSIITDTDPPAHLRQAIESHGTPIYIAR